MLSRNLALFSLLLTFCLPLGCFDNGPDEFEAAAVAYSAAECTADLDCLLAADSYAEADACNPGDNEAGETAAYDLAYCATESCAEECVTDGPPCRECIAASCSDAQVACDGYGAFDYEREPGLSCLEIWDCSLDCPTDDRACWAECYWSGAGSSRSLFFRHLVRFNAECPDECAESGEACRRCWRYMGPVSECYRAPAVPTGCEGLSGAALCICLTNNIGACS